MNAGERLENVKFNIDHHKPTEAGIKLIEANREAFKVLATKIVDNCPDGRELSLALTNLEQALFWANASVARNNTEDRVS